MKKGRVIVTPKDGKRIEVRVMRIPNVDLFLMLIGVKYDRLNLAYLF